MSNKGEGGAAGSGARAGPLGTGTAGTALAGVLAAVTAYLMWAGSVVFYKALASVPAVEVIAHRVVWSVVFTAIWLAWRGRMGEVKAALTDRRTAGILTLTSVLISFNWGIFVWAIAQSRVLEAALGYFMLPLVSVAIGFLLLGERLNRAQTVAVGLALVAVLAQSATISVFPWVAVGLALLFAFYGYLRKTLDIGSAPGLFVEVLLLGVPALGYIVYLETAGAGHFLQDIPTAALLVATGPITAIPLILYAEAVRRLRMVTVGLLFYLNPVGQFLIGAVVYGEPLSLFRLATFALIWLALVIFVTDALRQEKRRRRLAADIV